VERSIRYFKEVLKSKIVDARMKWKKSIKAAQSACNNFLTNATTKFTPHEVTRGAPYRSYMDNIIDVHNGISGVHKEVARNTKDAKAKQVANYNLKGVTVVKFKVDDWVMLDNHGKKKFLDPIRIGPFKIIKILANDNYLVHNHLRDKYLPYNKSQLVAFVPSAPKSVYGPVVDASVVVVSPPLVSPIRNNNISNVNISKSGSGSKSIIVNNYSNNKNNNNYTNNVVGGSILNQRISVFWPKYDKWYIGTVVRAHNNSLSDFEVQYDDDPPDDPVVETLDGPNKVQWSSVFPSPSLVKAVSSSPISTVVDDSNDNDDINIPPKKIMFDDDSLEFINGEITSEENSDSEYEE